MNSRSDLLSRTAGSLSWEAASQVRAALQWTWATPLRRALVITAVWRLATAVCGAIGFLVLPPGKADPFTLVHAGWPLNPVTLAIDAGVRNDGLWYAEVAQHGYHYSALHLSSIGFYPLYPLLIKAVSLVVGNVYVAGMMISTACLFLAVALLSIWLEDRGLGRHTPLATTLLLCFPFAFFYAAMYSESLYLALVLGTFVFYERHSWWLAALCVFLAGLARPTGVLLPPCLFVLMITLRSRGWKPWVPIAAGIAAVAVFAGYQYVAFGTPLAYAHTHAGAPEYATLTRAWQDLRLQPRVDLPRWYLASNLAAGLLFLAAVPLVYRRLGAAYAAFVALSVFLRLGTTLPGMERMVIVDFPVFVSLACVLRGRWLFISCAFSAYFLVFFTGAFAAHWGLF